MKIKDILKNQVTLMQKKVQLRKNASSSDTGETTDEERAEFERKYLMSEEEYQNALDEWENSDCVHAREEEIANEESQMIEEVLGLAQSVYPNDWEKYVSQIDTKLNQVFSDGMLTSVEFLLWLTNLKTDLENAKKSQEERSQEIVLKKKPTRVKQKEDEEIEF